MQRSQAIANATYYFSRAKDSCTKSGQVFITLFGRLTIETSAHSLCIWADLKEIAWDQAGSELKAAPNGIYTYKVQERIFHELEQLSQHQQNDLYSLVPLYLTVEFQRLAPISDLIG